MLGQQPSVTQSVPHAIFFSKACRTLDAKRANDILPKKYQIGTKVGTFFFFGGGGGHGKCVICTLNLEKCTDLVLFWSHTQIDEKTISTVIMMRMEPIWYNFKMCNNL